MYLEEVGETHGEATDNEAGVVEEQPEHDRQQQEDWLHPTSQQQQQPEHDVDRQHRQQQEEQLPVHLEREDAKYQPGKSVCDTLVMPWLVGL